MRVVLKIRTAPGRILVRGRRPNRRLAEIGASLVWLLALFAMTLCVWRWGHDLSWIERFPFSDGLVSHWQVWFVIGAALHWAAGRLRRYAGDTSSDAVTHS